MEGREFLVPVRVIDRVFSSKSEIKANSVLDSYLQCVEESERRQREYRAKHPESETESALTYLVRQIEMPHYHNRRKFSITEALKPVRNEKEEFLEALLFLSLLANIFLYIW